MNTLLHNIVDQSAEHYPDGTAFRFGGDSLTYADLRRCSDALAASLADLGVRPGDRVGLFMRKSLKCAVSVFGIMKAGAAYVSIDPRSPRVRVARIAADCGMRAIICDEKKSVELAHALDTISGVDFVVGPPASMVGGRRCVSWTEIENRSAASRPATVGSDDLAYIIYTSGSTGEPKGIMHTHGSALAYARCAAHMYDLKPTDVLSNHSPLHFDMSTFDYFAGPLAGAATVIIPESHMMLPASLAELIEKEQLTIWYSVPLALVQLLLRGAPASRDLSSLRWVLFGGEPFPVKHLRRLMTLLPEARFGNVYGPAEVNQCTFFMVPSVDSWEDGAFEKTGIPIGDTWPAAVGYIIDEDGSLIEDDRIGELLISTNTMMRGYWGKPAETDASIVMIEGDDGAVRRYYRTGDLVRRRTDGELLFVGRGDRQVKIRGHRIELDEIEASLITHDNVVECAVVTSDNGDGSRSLAAFVVAGGGVTASELKGHLSRRLPGFAVPAEIQLLTDFPRTSTGKIDRNQLLSCLPR